MKKEGVVYVRIQYNYLLKKDVIHCKASQTLEEALQVLEKTGYRCIPVLDNKKKKFLGNIYQSNIYRYMAKQEGPMEANIMTLVKNEDHFVYESAPFLKVFFNIRRLPYLAVLNDQDEFLGILPHSKLIDVFEDAWGKTNGGYSLTIAANEYQGALYKMVSYIRKHHNIEGLITIDDEHKLYRRIIVTIPKETTEKELTQLVKGLERKGFAIPTIINLTDLQEVDLSILKTHN